MRFGGGSERDTHYKKSGRPHHSIYSWTVRGILADRPPLNFLHCQPTETASGKFFPTQADCPRIYAGPSAPYSVANHRCIRSLPDEPMTRGPSAVLWRTVRSVILRLRTSLQSLWRTSLMNGGLSASYPRTVRCTKFQTNPNKFDHPI